jgi:hypothetical protein
MTEHSFISNWLDRKGIRYCADAPYRRLGMAVPAG